MKCAMRSMRSYFSDAPIQKWKKIADVVGPLKACPDVLANDGFSLGAEDAFGAEDELEGRVICSQKTVYQHSRQQWGDCKRTHIPFRKWRACWVRGKCATGAHKRSLNSASDRANEILVICPLPRPKNKGGQV